MTSLIEKEISCEPPEEKKCKVPKKKSENEKQRSEKERIPDCIEPQPPEYKEKVLYEPNAVDPFNREREKCLTDCKVEPVYNTWKECEKRVTRKSLYTAETCHEETIDLMEALDKCVQDKAFLQLE